MNHQNESKISDTTNQKEHPEIVEVDWIDDAFHIEKTRFGLYRSIKKNGDGFLTGGTYDGVLQMSRWHLKCEQEGTLDDYTRVVGSAIVDGKL